jgi:glycerophosphoryl diester phosphodiesterase
VAAQDWLTSNPIAHRGLFDNELAPENTIAAFDLAISCHYAVELDVRLTKDGKVIVFHDPNLLRLTGRNKNIVDCNWKEIEGLTVFCTRQSISLLDSVLRFVNGRVPVLIDVKNEGWPGSLETAVAEVLDCYSGEFAVQSFNPLSIIWFRKNRPAFCRGQIAGDFRSQPEIGRATNFILKNMYLNGLSRPHFVAYDVRAGDISFFTKLKNRLKIPLVLWTIDSGEKFRLCQSLGVNYIFEKFAASGVQIT